MKKVLVAHPFRQHSFKVVEALNENSKLEVTYCTTIYDKKKSFMSLIKKIVKGDNLKKANGRKSKKINDNQVLLFCEIRGYIAILLNRFCPFSSINGIYRRYLYRSFGKKVAKYAIKNNIDIIIMFDMTASKCFEIVKKSHKDIKLILDMSAASIHYRKKILDEEYRQIQSDDIKGNQKYLWNKKIFNYFAKEISYADSFIVASNFTRESLIYAGINDKKITIIPYGINTEEFTIKNKNDYDQNENLNVLFVGTIDYTKGLHHLLNVFDKLPQDKYTLNLYGVYTKNCKIFTAYKDRNNIHFNGHVTKDKLPEIYKQADLFVFPSTNDGFGFVILEAMSAGLTIACSNNVGASDYIKDNINGFLFDYNDEQKLKDILKWSLNNKDKLWEMGLKSRKIVEKLSWKNYNKLLNKYIVSIK